MATNPVNTLPSMGQNDPLSQLRDIHLPTPLDPGLPAIGWWLLAGLAMAALCWLAWWTWQQWQQRAYRREAVDLMDNLLTEFRHHQDSRRYLSDYSALLKRVALTTYPRADVAALTGEAWVDFLDRTVQSHDFSMGRGQALIAGHYEPAVNCDPDALHQLGVSWIRHHRPLTAAVATARVAA